MFDKGLIEKLNKNRVIWQRKNKDINCITWSNGYIKLELYSCIKCRSHYVFLQDGKSKAPNFCGYCGRKFEARKNIYLCSAENGEPQYQKGADDSGQNKTLFWEEVYKSNTCCFYGEQFGFYPYLNLGSKAQPYWQMVEGLLPRACPVCGEDYHRLDYASNYWKTYIRAPDFVLSVSKRVDYKYARLGGFDGWEETELISESKL